MIEYCQPSARSKVSGINPVGQVSASWPRVEVIGRCLRTISISLYGTRREFRGVDGHDGAWPPTNLLLGLGDASTEIAAWVADYGTEQLVPRRSPQIAFDGQWV